MILPKRIYEPLSCTFLPRPCPDSTVEKGSKMCAHKNKDFIFLLYRFFSLILKRLTTTRIKQNSPYACPSLKCNILTVKTTVAVPRKCSI